MKFKEIYAVEQFYDVWINQWRRFLQYQIHRLDLEIMAFDEWCIYNIDELADITLNGELCRKRIRDLERAKKKAIQSFLENGGLEHYIGQVFEIEKIKEEYDN